MLILCASLLLALALTACRAASPGSQTPALALEDCQLSAPGMAARLAARCGSLPVYEDRAAGTGRQISLNIAVVPAVSRSPQPDPLFLLSGGPGQSALETYVQLAGAFDRIHQKRDIVLVDQRGTGGSNPLDCPNLQDQNLDDLPPEADLSPYLDKCLEALDADPALYTTSLAVADLDQARAALGYDRVNLYGVSYGTRVAQVYLRQYPQQVRAVILDGVVPQDEALGLQVAADAQRALDLLFERCAADESCRQAFHDPAGDFAALLADLGSDPVTVSLAHPVSGEQTEVTFDAEELASAVRILSYTPETGALLPLLLHTARAEGDYRRLAAQYLIISGDLSGSISEGLNYSVLCTEDVPFYTPEQARQSAAGSYLVSLDTQALFDICTTWPHGAAPQSFKEPVQSDAPVLILSGEADPVTPPENGEHVAAGLPNSLHVVAPGQGHMVIYRGCIPVLAARFIDAGSVQGLDAACVQAIQPPPFFLNYSGPRP